MRHLLLAVCLFFTAAAPNAQADNAQAGLTTVYRCETANHVEYTNEPKPGCVVILTHADRQTAGQSPDSALVEQGYYTNSAGQQVHRPAHTIGNAVPAGASAQCRDGTYSFSTHRGGTCSHHGGVARWL